MPASARCSPLASMIVVEEPAPVIVTLFVMSRSPVIAASSGATSFVIVRLYVPAGSMIVSPPAPPFALRIAPRRLQSPGAALQAVAATAVLSSKRSTAIVAAETVRARRVRTARMRSERDMGASDDQVLPGIVPDLQGSSAILSLRNATVVHDGLMRHPSCDRSPSRKRQGTAIEI